MWPVYLCVLSLLSIIPHFSARIHIARHMTSGINMRRNCRKRSCKNASAKQYSCIDQWRWQRL